jgi:hypothetical protein
MRAKFTLRATVVYLALLVCASVLLAQVGNQGSIEGTASDVSGALIPAVDIRVTSLETSANFSTTTNTDGLFRFPVLPVGTYDLVAQCSGFAKLLFKGIVVSVGGQTSLPLTLQVAAHSDSIVVSGEDVPLLETARSSVASLVDRQSVANLPVNGRNYAQFVLLTPAVTRDVRGGLSFAGLRGMSSVLVDGADSDDSFFGQPLGGSGFSVTGNYQFSQEVVQEFQVNTNAYSAEFGRAGGAVIDVVTKSGTNHFHGAGFWYYRDKSLNANDAVAKLANQPKPPFHVNQYGGSVGGPIVKDRLFFFFNYDGQRSTIPNAVFLNLPATFHPSSIFQQRALDFLAQRTFSWVLPREQSDFFGKFDWHISPSHSLTAFFNRQRSVGGQGGGDAQNAFEHASPTRLDTDELVFSVTSVLSGALINVAHFNYVYADTLFLANATNPEAQIFEGGQLVLRIGRIVNPQDEIIHRGQWSDTINYQRGRHFLRTGADILEDRIRLFTAQNLSGSYQFNSLESFGHSLAGVPFPLPGDSYIQAFSGQATPGVTVNPNILEFAGFFQDQWRASARLTLNLGVRYDLQSNAKPAIRNPAPSLAAAGLDTSFLKTDKDNVAPRIGIAWAPLPVLVVRGGYGLYYGRTIAALNSRAHFQNGVTVQTRTFRAGTTSAALFPSYPNNLCGPPPLGGAPPSCAPPSVDAASPLMLFSPRYTQLYTQQATVGMEFSPAKNLTIGVTYLMVKGTHLPRVRDVNLGTPTTTTSIPISGTATVLQYQKFTLPRPIVGFGRILSIESAASSIYHALALQVNKRLSTHFQLDGSYTFGKAIDDAPNPYALNAASPDPTLLSDPSNPSADRGPGLNDQPHRMTLSGIWELDYVKAFSPVASAVFGGWQLSGIFTAQSGQPYSAFVNFDLNNDGNSGSDRTPGTGRDTFRLPASFSFDPRVTRTIKLNERIRLQWIWEAFNVFNHTNISSANTTQFAVSSRPGDCGPRVAQCLVRQATFGAPLSTFGPRIMEFSARLSF